MSAGQFEPGRIPSLLMEAAQSAARADGLVPPEAGSMDAANDMQAAVAGLGDLSAMQQARAAMAVSRQLDTSPKPPDMHMQRKASLPQGNQGGGGGGSSNKKKGHPLRRGKWTPEEEAYANRLIQEFKAGLLPLTDGTTLRTFLSKLLNCDPMRISKKFVGSNCIGKQVFRRRTADLNRLTPEQIQQSRAELSELERRFLERVAQTNRVKSSGVGGGGGPAAAPPGNVPKMKEDMDHGNPPSPPWLQPPLGYKQGTGASMAHANLAGGEANSRAAAAGRALLQGLNPGSASRKGGSSSGLASSGSAGLLAMAELQRRASQQSLLQNMGANRSAQNLLAAAAAANASQSASQGSAMAQMARNASAARMAGLGGGNNSVNNLMLKTGFSRDQLSQLARERGLSSASLSNMIERQNSFDALMSLDFQSLQSIDNLANLIQTGGGQGGGGSGGSSGQVPESGMKNWSAESGLSSSRSNLAAAAAGSSGNLSNAARRLASAGRMESLLRSLSSNNMRGGGGDNSNADNGSTSNANLSNLLQSMSSMQGGLGGSSMSSLLGSGNAASAVSLANLLRENSSTGLTALRMQDGLNQRNSSVEDFLSLVAAGDIPHQDPSLLNVPLMQHQQGNNQGGGGGDAAANLLAQQQLLAQATGNPALANALASRSFPNLRNNSGNLSSSGSAAALFARAAEQSGSSMSLKRKLLELDGGMDGQGGSKR